MSAQDQNDDKMKDIIRLLVEAVADMGQAHGQVLESICSMNKSSTENYSVVARELNAMRESFTAKITGIQTFIEEMRSKTLTLKGDHGLITEEIYSKLENLYEDIQKLDERMIELAQSQVEIANRPQSKLLYIFLIIMAIAIVVLSGVKSLNVMDTVQFTTDTQQVSTKENRE